MSVHMMELRSREGKNKYKYTEVESDEENIFCPKKKTSLVLCENCYDKKSARELFIVDGCYHIYCKYCMKAYIGEKIKQNIANVQCPDVLCRQKIEPKSCMDVVPLEVLERWESALCEATIDINQKIYCPFKDCSALLVNDDEKGEKLTACECPYCHRLFCAQCRVPWHGDLNCAEFKSSNEDDLLFVLAKKKKWMRCRKCGYVVEKKSHCDHITCRCGHVFCYKCGGNAKFDHLCSKAEAGNNIRRRHAEAGNNITRRHAEAGDNITRRDVLLLLVLSICIPIYVAGLIHVLYSETKKRFKI